MFWVKCCSKHNIFSLSHDETKIMYWKLFLSHYYITYSFFNREFVFSKPGIDNIFKKRNITGALKIKCFKYTTEIMAFVHHILAASTDREFNYNILFIWEKKGQSVM